MYKGNMKDFVDKVNVYLNKHYNCSITFGQYSDSDKTEYFVAFFAGDQVSAVGYKVFDSANFEQQIYDYVNNELEDVQWELNGFPEQPNRISGENISGD